MFFRILWFLIVTWLVAGLLRLVLGGARRIRRRPDPDPRINADPPPRDLPYSRDEIVDAKFSDVDENPPGSTDRT